MSAIHLTAREIDMLECLREGLENKNIAIRLGLTEATVKVHMRNLFSKLEVRNRVQAALWWDRRQDQRKEVLPALAAELRTLWGMVQSVEAAERGEAGR